LVDVSLVMVELHLPVMVEQVLTLMGVVTK
jgi:hypothetical protein